MIKAWAPAPPSPPMGKPRRTCEPVDTAVVLVALTHLLAIRLDEQVLSGMNHTCVPPVPLVFKRPTQRHMEVN